MQAIQRILGRTGTGKPFPSGTYVPQGGEYILTYLFFFAIVSTEYDDTIAAPLPDCRHKKYSLGYKYQNGAAKLTGS